MFFIIDSFIEIKTKITLNDISINAKSKREVYNALTVELEFYLSPLTDSNKQYLRGLTNN